VPVSCLAVLQGASLRAVWNRQFQRLLGTALAVAHLGRIQPAAERLVSVYW
jgi:hypothetical protein